jgi:GntR family transcriptional regulator/MocR family aminotransferase
LAYYRRIIDRQGDTILESAIAELLHEGVIQKYLRKSVREYRERRDFFCDLLAQHLSNEVSFQVPEGGMSVWARFDASVDLVKTAQNARKNGLYFSDGSQYGSLNATRLGFASSNLTELQQAVDVLRRSLT